MPQVMYFNQLNSRINEALLNKNRCQKFINLIKGLSIRCC